VSSRYGKSARAPFIVHRYQRVRYTTNSRRRRKKNEGRRRGKKTIEESKIDLVDTSSKAKQYTFPTPFNLEFHHIGADFNLDFLSSPDSS